MALPIRSRSGELKKPQVSLNKQRDSNAKSGGDSYTDERNTFKGSKQYLYSSPVRDLGSPIRLRTTTNSFGSLYNSPSRKANNHNNNTLQGTESFEKLNQYYSDQITKKEKKVEEIESEIKQHNAKLDALYNDKIQLAAHKTKLKSYLKELEVQSMDIDRELDHNNEVLNRSLEFELKKLKIALKQYDLEFTKEIDTKKLDYEKKHQEAQSYNSDAALQEIKSLQQQNRELQSLVLEIARKNTAVIHDKENTCQEAVQTKQKELQEDFKCLSETITAKQEELESKKEHLRQITLSHNEEVEKIAKLELKIKCYQENKLVSTEAMNNLNRKLDSLRTKNREKQTVLDGWEAEYSKHKSETDTQIRKLREEKFLRRRTEFAIQSLLERIRVFIRILYSNNRLSYENSYSDLAEFQIESDRVNALERIAINDKTFTASRIFRPLSDEEICEEFDVLMEDGFKCLNTSLILIGDQSSLTEQQLPFVLTLLVKSFQYLKDKYLSRLKPRGWQYEFSFQCLAISVTQNKFYDALAERNTQSEKQRETTISIGKRDIVANSTEICLSVENDNLKAYEQLANLSIPQGCIPFLLFHIRGHNKDMAKTVDSTSFMLDFTLGDSKSDMNIIVELFENIVVDSINQGKYQSSLYKDEIFLKQLIHSLYANTESVTTINIKEQNLRDPEYQRLLKLATRITAVNAPPKKRSIRNL